MVLISNTKSKTNENRVDSKKKQQIRQIFGL